MDDRGGRKGAGWYGRGTLKGIERGLLEIEPVDDDVMGTGIPGRENPEDDAKGRENAGGLVEELSVAGSFDLERKDEATEGCWEGRGKA